MLKKHALSIAEGSASFVLAALGGSTYRTEYAPPWCVCGVWVCMECGVYVSGVFGVCGCVWSA